MNETLDRRVNAYGEGWADLRLKGRVEAARFVEGRPGRVRAGLADLRRHPAGDAPLETQALPGESLRVFQSGEEGWSLVQLDGDSYVGWMESESIGPLEDAALATIGVPRTLVFSGPDIKSTPVGALMMGARVAVRGAARDHNASYRLVAPFGAVVDQHFADEPPDDFVAIAERFVGAPYLWGGKSVLGIDCTGLTQLALGMTGVAAPRDSDMQERWGTALDPKAARARGDLVFWKGHVGIMLDEARLLHANAHHMMTAIEPLAEAAARALARGSAISSIRRVPGAQ